MPSHVAPVYHGPAVIKYLDDFEHLVSNDSDKEKSAFTEITKIIKDDIDYYSVNPQHIEKQLADEKSLCELFTTSLNPQTPEQIKDQLARNTLSAINQNIPRCEGFTWSLFWPSKEWPKKEWPETTFNDSKTNSAKYFHQYGPPFFSKVSLGGEDKQNCELEENDPRYMDFVTERHVEAVKANMALLHWFFRSGFTPPNNSPEQTYNRQLDLPAQILVIHIKLS